MIKKTSMPNWLVHLWEGKKNQTVTKMVTYIMCTMEWKDIPNWFRPIDQICLLKAMNLDIL